VIGARGQDKVTCAVILYDVMQSHSKYFRPLTSNVLHTLIYQLSVPPPHPAKHKI